MTDGQWKWALSIGALYICFPNAMTVLFVAMIVYVSWGAGKRSGGV